MRIDKYLKNSRIIKRRTVAKDACEQGRVLINEKEAKPGDRVEVEDIVEVNFGTGSVKVEVLKLSNNVRKSDAVDMYKNID